MSVVPGRMTGIALNLRDGAAAPLVVIAMLEMVIVPLAPLVLDGLFTINIALSLVVMLAVVYVKRPLEFSIFPSVLLM
ncbi:MAG TPA: FHIPEP family type III secretion protein, partial [Lysobacter sp.]